MALLKAENMEEAGKIAATCRFQGYGARSLTADPMKPWYTGASVGIS